MKTLTPKITGALIGVSILAGIAWGAYLALEWVIAMFAGLDTEVARVTGLASLVVLLSAAIVAQSIRAANRPAKAPQVSTEVADINREERLASYQLFLDFWQNAQRQGKPAAAWQGPMADKLEVLERLLALHGSVALVQAHAKLRKQALMAEATPAQLQACIAQALLAIREELGSGTSPEAAQALQELLFAPIAPASAGAASTRLHTAFSLRS